VQTFNIALTDPAIVHLKKADPKLAVVIDLIGSIDCHTHIDGFSFVIEEIVGQMLSNKVADVISDRLRTLCGGNISVKTIQKLCIEDLRGIGLSRAKAEYIKCFAEAVSSGAVKLEDLANFSDDQVMKCLMSIRGIGSWTAKMYLLFVLRRPNILPFEDGAFLQSFRWLYQTDDVSKQAVQKQCKCWEPYSSVAARYMYRALDTGLTKTSIHFISTRHNT